MIRLLSIITFTLILSFFTNAKAQTVGLIFWEEGVTDGYTLFTPSLNNNVFLINNCGEKVNEWTFSERPGATCYLLENGNLLRAGRDSLEIRDWDNNLIWSYATQANGITQHHDIEPLPNGNILCVTNDYYSNEQMEGKGRTNLLTNGDFKLDKVVELMPIGENNAEIVWEWKIYDHFVQDVDPTKANYGIINEHPELFNINIDYNNNDDWSHVNAIDYNPTLDQIIITARNLSEIYIIDHSTTTNEAAGHTGGNSNKGGDILWRWGNPQNYSSGSTNDQKLFYPHDSKWVSEGYLDQGKISVFNNDGDGTGSFSSVHLINPEIVNGVYTISNTFNPIDFDWSWNGDILGELMFSNTRSGTHSLPNGNFIICETNGKGKISEITKDGDHKWTYVNPSGESVFDQFSTSLNNPIFRAEKYPVNYIGFNGKDLTPNGIIENENSNSVICANIVSVESNPLEEISIVNPINSNFIQFNQTVLLDAIQIIDINGRILYSIEFFNDNKLNINLNTGIYFIQMKLNDDIITKKIVVN